MKVYAYKDEVIHAMHWASMAINDHYYYVPLARGSDYSRIDSDKL